MRKLSKKLYLLSVCAILVCVFSTVLGCSGDPTPEPEVVNYTVTFDLCTELQTTKVLPQTVVAGSRIESINSDIKDESTYIINLTVTVRDRLHLAGVMRRIKAVPNVLKIFRRR